MTSTQDREILLKINIVKQIKYLEKHIENNVKYQFPNIDNVLYEQLNFAPNVPHMTLEDVVDQDLSLRLIWC